MRRTSRDIGLSLVFAPSFSLGTFGVARDDAGVASASINVAQQVGGSVGTSLLNTIATTAAAGYVMAHASAITSSAAGELVAANALLPGEPPTLEKLRWVAAAHHTR